MKKSQLLKAFEALGYLKFYEDPMSMYLHQVCKMIAWDYFIGKLNILDDVAIQVVRKATAEFDTRGYFQFDPEDK